MQPNIIEIFNNRIYTPAFIADMKMIPYRNNGFCSETTIKKLIENKELIGDSKGIKGNILAQFLESNFPDVRISRIHE